MRPIHLSMTAFGPFAGQEEIHFEALGENPLFLINGPTGSGKTTILDAICFALYGKTTGDEREGAQMRCDLATAETLTEVTLCFELSGRRFRIRRVPEQQRPKARGEGTTTQSPEAQLYTLNADGSEQLIVSSKVTEATREIETLTGLSVDQFRQVMVLPQGQFRQLLMAESADREKIFSQLFQTRIYKRLEENLKAQSAEIRRERERQLQLRQGILEGAGVESTDALEQELAELRPGVDSARALKEAKEEDFNAAGKAQQQALGLHQAFAELEKTEHQQISLNGQKEAFERQRRELKSAEQARKLRPVFDDLARCQRELQQAANRVKKTESELEQATLKRNEADRELQKVEPLTRGLDAAKQETGRLDGLRARAARLAETRQALEQAERSAAAAREAHQQALTTLQNTSRQREAKEEEKNQRQKSQANLGELQLQLRQLADRLNDRSKMEALEHQLRQQQGQLTREEARGKTLREEYEAKTQQAKGLELAWHQGQAAILAAELCTGEPCPVCGSSDHPAPAHSEEPLPSQKELEQARALVQKTSQSLASAREAYGETRGKVVQSQEQLEQCRLQLGETTQSPISELQQAHDALKAQVETLQGQGRQLEALGEALQRLKQNESDARQSLDQAAARVTETSNAAAAARAQAQSAEQELPQDYRQAGALDAAIGRAQGEANRLEQQIHAAREAHKLAHGRWEAAQATLRAATETGQAASKALEGAARCGEKAIAESPFASEQAYREAVRDEASLETLQQSIADYDRQCQLVAGALGQQQAALEGKARPDLSAVEEALRKAEQEKGEALAHWQQLDARAQQLEATRKKLEKASAAQAELDRQYAVVGTLSDVANGQTGDKISLQRFVLSVLLDDVLIEASHRLSLMSKGRYQLLRKEDRAKGNKASGLELEVEDAYTGKVRPVATLSGGESFMAALSLALGLSDVVQAYAGGIRLDTLFIDEGFGSLDAESLDLAVRTLIDLQAAGRMVGVISHVAELKEQMPLRLDLTAGRDGSRIRLVKP